MFSKYLIGTATLAIVAAGSASAQPVAHGAADGDGAIVVTASRATQEAREIGSSVTVISRGELERHQVTFVNQFLQDVPGVLTTTDRPGDFTSVSIRGSNSDEVLWLIDGIELGDPSSTSTSYNADHLIAADIERMEILRGNQSSLYGSDAIGGVINIVTRRATEEGFAVAGEAEVGSHETTQGGLSLLGKSGALDFRVTATGYRHGGPSLTDPATATGPANEKDEYWRYGLSGRTGIEANSNLRFQIIGFWLDSFSDLDNTTSDNLNTVEKREYGVAGQGAFTTDDAAFTAELTASRYNARRLYFGSFNRPEGDKYDGTKDTLSLDLTYNPGGFVSFAAGGNLEWEETDQITNNTGNFEAGIDTKSAYGEVALRPTSALTLTGAARVDDNSRFGSFDTYRATAAYVVGPAKLRASYGTGAKAPGLYQLFDPTYGNPNLLVEESSGWDVGVDLNMFGSATAQVSYFELKKSNEIVFDSSRPPFGGYDQWGQTRARGIEVGLTAAPAGYLRLSQTITYTDHEIDNEDDGTYVDSGRPSYFGTSSVTLVPNDALSITARARYRGENAASFGGMTAGYIVLDLLASLALTDKIEIYGRIENLFDRYYQASYGKNALGRSAYGGMRVNF